MLRKKEAYDALSSTRGVKLRDDCQSEREGCEAHCAAGTIKNAKAFFHRIVAESCSLPRGHPYKIARKFSWTYN